MVIGLSLVLPLKAAEKQPNTEGAATIPNEQAEKKTEFVLRLGNESNPVDGIFGPFTYGLRGSHQFDNEFGIEAGYIRMHEPNTPSFNSVLDEAQVTLRSPESRSYAGDMTAWKNRMIDMYTNLVGIELTCKDKVSVTGGAFLGAATKDELSENFQGVQLGFSVPISDVDFGGACLVGKIESGSYRKCGIEAGRSFRESSSLPFTATFGIEERYFDFGNGGPISEAQDEWISIAGLEIHFEKVRF